MFASLLPGLRELRAPLAAGYVWLLFAYFAAGTPTSISDVPGPLGDLLTVLDALGAATIAIAVSFVAYLIGSLSQDLFDQLLPRGLQLASSWLPRHIDVGQRRVEAQLELLRRTVTDLEGVERRISETERERSGFEDDRAKAQARREEIGQQITGLDREIAARQERDELRAAREEEREQRSTVARELTRNVAEAKRARDARDRSLGELRQPLRLLQTQVGDELDGLLPMLDELRAAGASEAEKPEALRPMVEAEAKLRTAIFPPTVSVMTYLAAVESLLWAIGVVFALALFAQAVARRVEANRLAEKYYRALSVEEIEAELKKMRQEDDLNSGRLKQALRRLRHQLSGR